MVSVPGFLSARLSVAQASGAAALGRCPGTASRRPPRRLVDRRAGHGGEQEGHGEQGEGARCEAGAWRMIARARPVAPETAHLTGVRHVHLCNSLHRERSAGTMAAMALEHAILVSLSRATRLGPGPDPPLRPVDRLLLERHPPADLPRARPDGGRRLGRLEPVAQHGPARQEGVRRRRRRPPRAAPVARRSPPRCEPFRSEVAVKLRAASYGDRAAVLAQVDEHRAEHATRLAHYERWPRATSPSPARLAGHDLDVYLVLRGGIRLEQFWVDWLTEYLDRPRRRSLRR